MAEITVFSGATGINNIVDPVRLKFDPDTGIGELAEAVNVVIDQTGRISRKHGMERWPSPLVISIQHSATMGIVSLSRSERQMPPSCRSEVTKI